MNPVSTNLPILLNAIVTDVWLNFLMFLILKTGTEKHLKDFLYRPAFYHCDQWTTEEGKAVGEGPRLRPSGCSASGRRQSRAVTAGTHSWAAQHPCHTRHVKVTRKHTDRKGKSLHTKLQPWWPTFSNQAHLLALIFSRWYHEVVTLAIGYSINDIRAPVFPLPFNVRSTNRGHFLVKALQGSQSHE